MLRRMRSGATCLQTIIMALAAFPLRTAMPRSRNGVTRTPWQRTPLPAQGDHTTFHGYSSELLPRRTRTRPTHHDERTRDAGTPDSRGRPEDPFPANPVDQDGLLPARDSVGGQGE